MEIYFQDIIKTYKLNPEDQSVIEFLTSINQVVSKKLNALITYIYNNDINKWNESLKIANNKQSVKHFNSLVELMLELKDGNLTEELISNFGSELIGTQELINQITKLVSNNFEES
jgi:hypothetical protein